jgi:preprotein translocase subunit SecG
MGHGIGSVVGKGEKSLFDSEGVENFRCLSMKREIGRAHV